MKQKRKFYTLINNILKLTTGWGMCFTAACIWALCWMKNGYPNHFFINLLITVFTYFLLAITLMNSIISFAGITPASIIERANRGALRGSLTQQKEPLDTISSALEDEKLRKFYGSDKWFWLAVLAILVLLSIESWHRNALSEFITLLNVIIVFAQAKTYDKKIEEINKTNKKQ